MTLPWRSAATIALVSILLFVAVRLRPPGDWVATHFLFTYDFGFQRRALFGEMLSWVFPDGLTWMQANAVAAGLTLVSTVLLVAYVWQGCRKANTSAGGVWLVLFATSLGLGTWIGNTGYLDACALISVLGALSLDTRRIAGLALAAALVSVSVLFHENALPYFAPLVAFHVWLQNEERPLGRRLARAVVLMLAAVLAAWAVVRFGTHPFAMLEPLSRALQTRSIDFPVWSSAVDTVVTLPPGGIDPFTLIWSNGFNAFLISVYIITGLIVFLPTLALVAGATGHRPWLDRIGVVAVAVAPLTLLFVAFDVSRFLAVAMLNIYLVGAILMRRDPQFGVALARMLTPANVLVLMLFHAHLMLQDLNQGDITAGRAPGAILTQVFWIVDNSPSLHPSLIDPQPEP